MRPNGGIGLSHWRLHDFDPVSGQGRFVRAARADLVGAPFLDDRWDVSTFETRSALLPAAERPVEAGFLWHTGFCGSTLIAACLDSPGRLLPVREPKALMTLANLKRTEVLAGRRLDEDRFVRVVAALARGETPSERVLLKPTNAAGNLIREAARLTRGPMLLLYSDCRQFLISLLKKGESGRAFARSLFLVLEMDGRTDKPWSDRDLFKLTDLQIAALAWRLQIAELAAGAAALGPGRAVALNFASFLDQPEGVLAALDAWFGAGLGEAGVRRVLDGPLMRTDAKQRGRPMSVEMRKAQAERLEDQFGAELDRLVQWSGALFPQQDGARPLGPELAPAAPAEPAKARP